MSDMISTSDNDTPQANQGEVELEPILPSQEITPDEEGQLRRSHRIKKQPDICRYLAATKDKGFILKPSGHKFECYVDSSYAEDWKQHTAMNYPSTAESRTGYMINFLQCPLVWASRLQTEIALSLTEAECTALSMASREILPLLSLAKEASKNKIINKVETPVIRCKIFEDNQEAVEMANVHKMHPRTKHLNIKYHFF
jgi:hypothetical protein